MTTEKRSSTHQLMGMSIVNDISAIVFDLYGTLLLFNQRAFLRDLREELQPSNDRRCADQLRRILVRSYEDDIELLKEWCCLVGADNPSSEQLTNCRTVLDRHLDRITVVEGARTLLAFLRRRGFQLGILSNTAQPFTSPIHRLGIDQYFDQILFSCDLGMAKPSPESYLEICRRLDASPEQCLFVGDSKENDYRVPISLGMVAVHLHRSSSDLNLPTTIPELMWSSISLALPTVQRLIQPGTRLSLESNSLTIAEVKVLPDTRQGRYNIVADVSVTDKQGLGRSLYAKRYLEPQSAHIEELAYSVLGVVNINSGRAAVLQAQEPVLIVTPALGTPWSHESIDNGMAYGIGGHCAAAYLIANADLRPRNTFVFRDGESTKVFVIDL